MYCTDGCLTGGNLPKTADNIELLKNNLENLNDNKCFDPFENKNIAEIYKFLENNNKKINFFKKSVDN